MKDSFSRYWGSGVGGMVSEWFKCIIFILHLISNLMAVTDLTEVPVLGPEVGHPGLDHGLSVCASLSYVTVVSDYKGKAAVRKKLS